MQGRLENILGALVITLSDEIREATEEVADGGPAAPAALSALLRRPEQSIEMLRQVVGLSHSATVRLVDRLEHDGLVARRRALDGRAVALVLTAKGRRRTVRLQQARRQVLSRTLVGLSTVERRHLEETVDQMLRTQAPRHEVQARICRLCELAACPLKRCPVPGGR